MQKVLNILLILAITLFTGCNDQEHNKPVDPGNSTPFSFVNHQEMP